MTLSILAAFFLLFLIGIIFYGYGFVVKSTRRAGAEHAEQCSICRNTFDKQSLIEREIGDFKIMYFCRSCINALHESAAKLQ